MGRDTTAEKLKEDEAAASARYAELGNNFLLPPNWSTPRLEPWTLALA